MARKARAWKRLAYINRERPHEITLSGASTIKSAEKARFSWEEVIRVEVREIVPRKKASGKERA